MLQARASALVSWGCDKTKKVETVTKMLERMYCCIGCSYPTKDECRALEKLAMQHGPLVLAARNKLGPILRV